jgi:predicted HicB family RNase H-like nuclease
MPRPRVYDEPRISTAIRLPESLHERLKREALERDVSVNYLINRAIAQYLDVSTRP